MKKKLPTPQKLPSGMWRCQVMVAGKRVSVVDEDPGVAQARAVALKAGLIKESKEQEQKAITLEDAIREYIALRDNVLSPSTIRGYHVILENRFPAIMKMNVHKIDENDLQAAINQESGSKSVKTIKNGMGLILSVLGQYKIINAKRLRYPQQVKKEHPYLDGSQIVKLISACEGDIAEIPILLGLWLGLRRSEIMGLQWESIDLEHQKIHIERSMVPDKNNNHVIKNTTKTKSSNRILDCPAYIIHKLEKYQPDQSKRKGLVFSFNCNTIYKNLAKICQKEDIPFVGVHGLRHTNASVMLSLGIVDKIAMARGGWSSKETMERIYQHIFNDDKKEADNTINQYFDRLIAHEITHDN